MRNQFLHTVGIQCINDKSVACILYMPLIYHAQKQ